MLGPHLENALEQYLQNREIDPEIQIHVEVDAGIARISRCIPDGQGFTPVESWEVRLGPPGT